MKASRWARDKCSFDMSEYKLGNFIISLGGPSEQCIRGSPFFDSRRPFHRPERYHQSRGPRSASSFLRIHAGKARGAKAGTRDSNVARNMQGALVGPGDRLSPVGYPRLGSGQGVKCAAHPLTSARRRVAKPSPPRSQGPEAGRSAAVAAVLVRDTGCAQPRASSSNLSEPVPASLRRGGQSAPCRGAGGQPSPSGELGHSCGARHRAASPQRRSTPDFLLECSASGLPWVEW